MARTKRRVNPITGIVPEAPQNRVYRAAGYARLSMEDSGKPGADTIDEQKRLISEFIQTQNDMSVVGLYADEGISGTSTKRREGFNRMVEDALAGKIGLILTKSVSRFARNTVDSLTTIRKLKEHGTEVYFEKENIWTFDSKGELLLTIMSSLAQEESRSISLNVTWGQRKRFADGKATVPFGRFLGYDRGEHGELVINEEEADKKVKAKIAELDHWTDKQETKATIDTLIRDTLWAELPECYDEISISTYRQKIYEYVYTRYPEVA